MTALRAPVADLDAALDAIGEAGRRLSEIGASEGAAGNISVYLGALDPRVRFPDEEAIELPEAVPELAGDAVLVTGSGRRLREIKDDPAASIGCLVVDGGGTSATLHTSPRRRFERLTSELNSHLAVHRERIVATGVHFHALLHAQPLHLTYLSHVEAYQDEGYLNRHLLRWQPETIVNLPDGIRVVPFCVPGSAQLRAATVDALRTHSMVLWSRHGVMSRSGTSVKRACDRIEYAETGARYEYLNLVNGERAGGLSGEQIRAICASLGIRQSIF
ncbi:MAG: class II aldolase/adducin family protein [Gaiellaceae bacterium]